MFKVLFKVLTGTSYSVSTFAGVDNNGDNEAVKSNSFSENEDEDHTNEDTISLCVSSNTGITSNTNS